MNYQDIIAAYAVQSAVKLGYARSPTVLSAPTPPGTPRYSAPKSQSEIAPKMLKFAPRPKMLPTQPKKKAPQLGALAGDAFAVPPAPAPASPQQAPY